MMPIRSASSSSSIFCFVSHRLLTVIVAFGQAMGAAATLATAKAAVTLAAAKAAARMIRNGVGKKRSREEEQSWDEEVQANDGQQMVVAEDDLAMVLPEDGLAMVLVPDNDLAMVVAPAIPQPGDMTMPIVVEDYIPLPPLPRHSWRIRMRKEKEKKNEE